MTVTATDAGPTPSAATSPDRPPVAVFGIRHHGPGSARSLLAALEDYQPDAVLIEGPADANPLLRWVLDDAMVPPLALLAYAPQEPKRAAFWPYAVFSPEWQAMTWARRRDVEVNFCDLPAAMVLAPRAPTPLEPDEEAVAAPVPIVAPLPELAARARQASRDPLGALAEAAGYDDPERWWDDVVELRGQPGGDAGPPSPFPALTEAMAELRAISGAPRDREADRERRREAYMRQTIRAALRRGRERVAVVCGAWHAPVLTWPLPPAAPDAKILRGTARQKVMLTWVPWTSQRLASGTGYGAGVSSPGWYHHLWTAPDRPVARWLIKVAHALRDRDLPVSSADVIEAVRLAETLAGLRLRPLAGLAEVTDATRSVLCGGDELGVRYVTDQLVVGQALGSVPDAVPTVPLDADLAAQCRTLRLRREADLRVHDLDLRRPLDQARSQLFHRLRLLDLDWVTPAESAVASQGTFRETWESRWQPEYAVALVEAAVWGTTVESAATARVEEVLTTGSLPELTRTVEHCLLAALPEALAALLTTCENRAALDADVVHLMDALPALARAQRYGDVRGTDTAALRRVAEVLAVRICTGLPQAVSGLNDESAAGTRRRLDAVTSAIGLLAEGDPSGADLRARWWATCRALVDRNLHGLLVGRLVRVLLDAEQLSDAPARLARALSYGVPASAKAAWVDGFFSDGALLMVHDAELRGLLDQWLLSLDDTGFADVLPLVRRTFGTFTPAERRSIAAGVAAAEDALPGAAAAVDAVDEELAADAVATVELILGWRR